MKRISSCERRDIWAERERGRKLQQLFLQNSLRVGEDRQVDRWRSWLVPPGPFGDLTRLFQEGARVSRLVSTPGKSANNRAPNFSVAINSLGNPDSSTFLLRFRGVSIADTARKRLLMVILLS